MANSLPLNVIVRNRIAEPSQVFVDERLPADLPLAPRACCRWRRSRSGRTCTTRPRFARRAGSGALVDLDVQLRAPEPRPDPACGREPPPVVAIEDVGARQAVGLLERDDRVGRLRGQVGGDAGRVEPELLEAAQEYAHVGTGRAGREPAAGRPEAALVVAAANAPTAGTSTTTRIRPSGGRGDRDPRRAPCGRARGARRRRGRRRACERYPARPRGRLDANVDGRAAVRDRAPRIQRDARRHLQRAGGLDDGAASRATTAPPPAALKVAAKCPVASVVAVATSASATVTATARPGGGRRDVAG